MFYKCCYFSTIHPLIEEENEKIRRELVKAKAESDKLIAKLMDPDRLKKEEEDLLDFLKRNEVSHEKLGPEVQFQGNSQSVFKNTLIFGLKFSKKF